MALYSLYTDSPEILVSVNNVKRPFVFVSGGVPYRLLETTTETTTQRVALTQAAAEAGAEQEPDPPPADTTFDVTEDNRIVGSYVLTKRVTVTNYTNEGPVEESS